MPLFVALFSILAFSVNDLLYRMLGASLSPWAILLTVAGSLFIVSAVICHLRGERLLPSPLGGKVAWLTFWRVLNSLTAVFTFQHLPVSQAYLLIFTYPVMIVLFQAIFYRYFRWMSLWAVILGLAGLGLVFYTQGFSSIPGVLLGLLCAATIAGEILTARKLQSFPVAQLSVNYTLWTIAVGILGLWLFPSAPAPTLSPALPALALLAIVNPLGSLAAVYAAQKLSSAHYAFLTYLQIPLAIILAQVFLHEPITLRITLGLILIVSGSLIAQRFPLPKANLRRGK